MPTSGRLTSNTDNGRAEKPQGSTNQSFGESRTRAELDLLLRSRTCSAMVQLRAWGPELRQPTCLAMFVAERLQGCLVEGLAVRNHGKSLYESNR